MKRFLKRTITISSTVLLLMVIVNYFGDAAHLFDNDYETRIASYLTSGQNVKNITNFDDRILQREVINNFSVYPKAIVLGSSRTLLMNQAHFPNDQFFNNSVTGASIEDLVAIYQIYQEEHIKLEHVSICIDPWTFNKNNGQNRWLSIAEYYNKFNEEINQSTFKSSKLEQLFSLSYFQGSLKNLPKALAKQNQPIPTNQAVNESFTKKVDGSISYDEEYRSATDKEVQLKAEKYISGNVYGLNHFDKIDKKQWSDFEELIMAIQAEGASIKIILSPYHPLVYSKIESDYQMVIQAENKVLDFTKMNNIPVYGSYNPKVLELDESYFYDGMHLKEKGINAILKQPVN